MSKNKHEEKNRPDENISEESSTLQRLSEEDVEVVNSKTYRVSCPMLNVRKAPKVEDNIALIVNSGTIVVVDENFNHTEWAKIIEIPEKISGHVELYCMKKFLTPAENSYFM